MKYTPHVYQQHATEHIIANPASGLFLDMGLGKTVSTLTAIDKLMFDMLEVSKTLIVAPKRVAENTWTNEITKWDHLRHFRVSLILGSEAQRKKALKEKADIHIINRENIVWLLAQLGGACPWDMLVVDESSSFKSAKAARFKALRMLRPKFKRVTLLTGTPVPNGLIDLWSQIYLLDQGERLGKTLGAYRDKYFKPGRRNGHVIFDYNLQRPESETEIHEKISDVCISMKARDWLELPPRVDVIHDVFLSPKTMAQYLEFEKEQILTLSDTQELSVQSATALSSKLLQFANGAVYIDDKKNFIEVHNEKIEALEETIEAANGNPMLVFYAFQHDVARIQKYLKKYKPRFLNTPQDMRDWEAGKITLAIGHPQSIGHGLNLQYGGHLVTWFNRPFGLEFYQQGVTRFDRQGQIKSVINRSLVAKGTMDEDVILSNERKEGVQEALMKAVKARIAKYKGQPV